MKHYLVTEHQKCYVEYLVGANSVAEARAKAKEVHDDAIELMSHPVYIESNKYLVKGIKASKELEDPVIIEAIKQIEKNYEPEEIERKKKLRRPRRKKTITPIDSTIKEKKNGHE